MPLRFQCREDGLDTGVHVSDCPVVLGDDVIFIGDARRHPTGKEIAEGLKVHHRIHRGVGWVQFIAVVKHPLVRCRGQVRGMGIHVAQEQEKGFIL